MSYSTLSAFSGLTNLYGKKGDWQRQNELMSSLSKLEIQKATTIHKDKFGEDLDYRN